MPSSSDPFVVDERFQSVFGYLQAPSATARWCVIQSIERIPPPPFPGAEPYLLELGGPLYEQAQRMEPVGVAPERLRKAASCLHAWRHECEDLHDLPEWRGAIDALEHGAARLFVFAGDPVQAARVLLAEADHPHALVPVLDVPQRATPAAIARMFLDTVDLPPRIASTIRSALGDLEGDHGGVYLPVVEQPAQSRQKEGIGGLIHLRITQEREQDAPSTRSSVQIEGVDSFGQHHVGTVEHSLHTVLYRQHGDASMPTPERMHHITVTSQPDGVPIRGTSFQLGLGGMVLSRIISRGMPRVRVDVAPAVGMTGGLTPGGEAMPVDPATLAQKVQTAFFSPLQTLAVPYGQEADADAVLRSLRKQFPHGKLHVVGVRSLSDILDRRRLTQRTEISRVQHATDRARANGAALGALVFALVLLGVLAYVLMPPVDQTPVRAHYSGSMLTVENRNGHVIEQVDVGSEIANSVRRQRRIRPYAFPRIGSEQTRTLVWAASDSARQEVIRARAIGGDTLTWEVSVDPEVLFPRKPFANRSFYQVENIYAGNTDGRRGDEIYALLNHTPYFPGLVVQLDAGTGAIIQTYIHPGHLTARIRHTDLNGDGQAELITGGYSNAFDCPVVVALDAEDFSGHGPATAPYIPADVRSAPHYQYMCLPESPVQQAAPKTIRFARFTSLVDGGVRFRVEDGTREDEMLSDIELFLHFNKRLRPVSVVPNTQHERLAEELVASGQLEEVPDTDAFQDYMKAIRYWNGENWQFSPTKQ